jgi:hypothetical protein
MKAHLEKTMFSRYFITAAAVLFFNFSIASGSVGKDFASTIQVKFLGGDNESMFFNVKYENRSGGNFRLVAVDENEEVLFEDRYSKRDLEKKIKVPRLTETEYVIFLIKSSRENSSLSCKVRVTTKVVDDVSVIKN